MGLLDCEHVRLAVSGGYSGQAECNRTYSARLIGFRPASQQRKGPGCAPKVMSCYGWWRGGGNGRALRLSATLLC